MSKGTVVIKEDAKGCLEQGLVRFTVTWPSGNVFTKYVDLGDDANERVRQQRFAEDHGYEVK